MDKHYADDSLALHTDLYQINMSEAYWADGMHERKAVFELFFRKLPFGNGYALFAGLERVLDYLKNFKFTDSDLEYLQKELKNALPRVQCLELTPEHMTGKLVNES